MCNNIAVTPALLNWDNSNSIKRGFKNISHSCFINSTLQCLLYTPPIQNLSHTCSRKFCTLSLLQELFMSDAKIPEKFLEFLFNKTKKFSEGQQEDAHETLRFLIDHIYPKSIGDFIFGGTLVSTVECQKCLLKSEMNENFLDLSLELTDFTLETCLDSFCKKELLDARNKYFCTGCKKNTVSSKQFIINSAPIILTFHLKRFGNNGSKDKGQLHFPEKLDIRKYMKKRQRQRQDYELYAVLVHTGNSCRVGHYYSYIKGPDSLWYLANDLSISKSTIKKVLNDRWAYILFYKKAPDAIHLSYKKAKMHENYTSV